MKPYFLLRFCSTIVRTVVVNYGTLYSGENIKLFVDQVVTVTAANGDKSKYRIPKP